MLTEMLPVFLKIFLKGILQVFPFPLDSSGLMVEGNQNTEELTVKNSQYTFLK